MHYEEAQHEGYGPGGAALIIDVLTDNKNRTVGEIRHVLEKHGGNLAPATPSHGCSTRRASIVIEKSKADEEKLMAAVSTPAPTTCRTTTTIGKCSARPEDFNAVRDAVKALGIEPASAAVLDDPAEL